jgi:hypothetical protein
MGTVNSVLIGIGAAIAIIIIAIIVWLSISNAHLKAELATAQSGLAGCQYANDDFKSKAVQQNAVLGALQDKLKAVAVAANQSARVADASATKLEAAKAPAGDDCKAATGLMDAYLRGQR